MADSHQENEDDLVIPDTNEGDSNDNEDADEDLQVDLDLGELDLTSQDEFILDEVDVHIQENLEDELVKEALEKEDLGSISSEIQTLQEQSLSMNIKLKNRQAIKGELSQFVGEIAIPPSMVSHICDTPVTEQAFIEQLHELHHKIDFAKEQSFKGALSVNDVGDELEKLKSKFEEQADRDDLMGIEDNAKRDILFQMNIVALKNRSTIFTLGSRGSVLTSELEEPVIVPHAAQKSEKKYSFESLFRSMHFALLDNSCREYLFLADFFMVQKNSARDLFTAVFGKTLSLFLKQMDTYLESCFDAIGIFLCIHIVHRYRILMHKRSVPALDKYWDTVLEMSWPRFTYIVELNVDSVRNTDPQRLGVIDIRPHYITRRYAEFCAAIVSLNESFPDEKVNKVLAALQVEVENFILRMAAEFPLRKEQLIFLINNYDMMLAVLLERTSEDSKEVESFQQLLTARIQEFVEEALSPAFGGMIAFVKETEPLLERGQGQVIRPDEKRIQQLVRGFASDWKRSIENINQEIMRSFSNFKNGTTILQAALTQLIQYYHRFQKILSQHPFKRLPIRSELINIHHVMVEVKKHKTTF
ncbi:Vacuolar protein sorting-associated protein 52-like [Stylophora pistillata]|uniref:Vacuolar protein sorting-associated protein 52-like n=1 Tax=Stylophora pistillata TaxID=50429 RepID=A0A2B4SF86_STYPI|nr:Vacuolar protein sorting-associated protein 52-like [Stylophora pistillata]